MSKAIIWCRVSTAKQEFESQKSKLIQTATNEPYRFNESDLIVIGEAGASAIKMNDLYKKEVDQLIETIKRTPDLSTIFVWEVSRLARNEQAFYAMKAIIEKHKIQLICNVPQIKLFDDDGTMNNGMEVTLNLLVTLAKQEMDIKIARFKRGKEKKAKEGKYAGGKVPFGYRVDKDRGKLIVEDEKQGEIVRLIYNKYESGISQPKIARELNEIGWGNVKISLINNILTNESYTGKKIKQRNASYERAYPPLITNEQFQRCREIAQKNNTTASKAKNIYFAEHLIRCKSCGAYWSATSSKSQYHCAVAFKAKSVWDYEYHKSKKERCNNRLGIGINLLDSVLWDIAAEREALYRETAIEESIKRYKENVEQTKRKIASIQPRLDEVNKKKERLYDLYVEGDILREKYEEKKRDITSELDAIKAEETPLKNELKRLEETIVHLNSIDRLVAPDPIDVIEASLTNDWSDVEERSSSDYAYKHYDNIKKIKSTVQDKERYDIIHRQIKFVSINPIKIAIEDNNSQQQIKEGREIVVNTYLPYSSWDGDTEIVYLTISNKIYRVLDERINPYNYPIDLYPELTGDLYSEDGELVHKSKSVMWASYVCHSGERITIEISDVTEKIYLKRFRDETKVRRRTKIRQELESIVGDKIGFTQIVKMGELDYNREYKRIKRETIPFEMIGGKMYFTRENVKRYWNLQI